jgi:hypothetical protein
LIWLCVALDFETCVFIAANVEGLLFFKISEQEIFIVNVMTVPVLIASFLYTKYQVHRGK